MRKGTISFVMSFRPSAWNDSVPLDGFSWNLIFEYCLKMSIKIKVSLKSEKNNGYFTFKTNINKYTYLFISLNSERNETLFRRTLKTKSEFVIYVQYLSYYSNVKKFVQPDRPQMTTRCTRIPCWVRKSTNKVSEYVTFIVLHYNTGCTNAPQYYVTRTVPVLIQFKFL